VYLKTGENQLARDQFRDAMGWIRRHAVAMEYAFLAYETNQRQQARRIFDRVRKSGESPFAATAEQAFQTSTLRWRLESTAGQRPSKWAPAISACISN